MTFDPPLSNPCYEVTCSAPVNIAVIKYWGKRDSSLLLPTNPSLSLTLNQDDLKTTTTIRTCPQFTTDKLWLNGVLETASTKRLVQVLVEARKARAAMEANDSSLEKISQWRLSIASFNNFPTAAGLASSASGYACLVYCLAKLYDLPLNTSEISGLARLGSGSACRSLFGGYVKWVMGERQDGSDSLAVQVAPANHWDLAALIMVVSDARKDTGSTQGMQISVETSDLIQHRIHQVFPKRISDMEKAIQDRDFDAFAEITMKDSNQFHAVCLDTYPPIFYLNDISKKIIHAIHRYNSLFLNGSKGYKVCYTFDAGPNAVLYLPKENVPQVLALMDYLFPKQLNSQSSEYYGRAQSLLNQIPSEETQAICEKLGLQPYIPGSISRYIFTNVGQGPIVLSKQVNSSVSLLNQDHEAK